MATATATATATVSFSDNMDSAIKNAVKRTGAALSEVKGGGYTRIVFSAPLTEWDKIAADFEAMRNSQQAKA